MKLDDIPYIVRDMENEMPVHTKESARVPRNFSQGLPKKFMEYSAHVNNRFLNNHLGEIEDAYHYFPELHSNCFEKWQILHFQKYDILNHDGFFNSDHIIEWIKTHHDEPMIRGASQKILYGLQTAHGAVGCAGAELESSADNAEATFSDDFVFASLIGGTSGDCYDQIALEVVSATATSTDSYILGTYDDDGDINALYRGTAEISPITDDYSFKSLTEYTLNGSTNWLAFNSDEDINPRFCNNCTNERKRDAFTYTGSFPDPFVSGQTAAAPAHMKTAHT